MAAATQIGKACLRPEDTSTQMGKVEKELAKLHVETMENNELLEEVTKKLEEAMKEQFRISEETA